MIRNIKKYPAVYLLLIVVRRFMESRSLVLGSDDGLSPIPYQTITQIKVTLWWIKSLATKFMEICVKKWFWLTKMQCVMSCASGDHLIWPKCDKIRNHLCHKLIFSVGVHSLSSSNQYSLCHFKRIHTRARPHGTMGIPNMWYHIF